MKRILITLSLFCCFSIVKAQSFTGTVLDKKTNAPIVYADVYLPELNTGTTTNEKGVFTIEHLKQPRTKVQISYIGYKTLNLTLNTQQQLKQTFYLEEDHYKLQEIIVSAPVGKLQRESIANVTHLKMKGLQQNTPISLATAISNIPGVAQNTTGAGIGKPVIRGLSGNRIVTYAQGMRVENQQWGSEHGLGIGDIGIESVEVIKGAASLLYGSDALGGVLYFVDERYANHNSYNLSTNSKFLSNTLGFGNNVGLKWHQNKFKINVFGAYNTHSDYQLPNNKRVFNTRFNEKNIKTAFGYNYKNWITNLRYSFIQNNYGIAEDATFTTLKSKKFILPFQTINNHSLSFENNFNINNYKLTSVLGYSNNYRREFEDDKQNAALGLKLSTYTYNVKWHTPVFKNRYSFVVGSQGMHQQNKNNGEEILIPDATTNDFGVFGLTNIEFDNIQFQTGIRFDNRKIDTQLTDNIPAFNDSYQGVTFSGGGVYKTGKSKIRFNVSSGFRAPSTSELLSDGVHEGTVRYEKGNTHLTHENATQFDFTYTYTTEHLKFSVNPFYNSIKNYIYLSPTNAVIDGNKVYQYLQKDAFLYGGEMGVHYHPHQLHWLHLESNLSTVFAEDKNKNALPIIPQTKLSSTVSAEFKQQQKFNISNIFIQHVYKFKQTKVGQFETQTPSYQIVNAGVSVNLKNNRTPITLSTGVNNILNTQYIDHLSRFKTLDIPNPGINFFINLKINLNGKLKNRSI